MIVKDVSHIPSDTKSQLKFASQKLEELFIHQLFELLRKTSLFKDYPGSGFESQIFWSMWDDEVASKASQQESLGLAPMIYHWLETQMNVVPAASQRPSTYLPSRSTISRISEEVSAKISSPFGWRTHPIYGYRHFHTGVDIVLPKGSPIYAPATGTVEFAGNMKGYGNTVIVRADNGREILLAHLDSISVRAGDKVQSNDKIGTVGETGDTTGPHLHLEVRIDGNPVNPLGDKSLSKAIKQVLLKPEEERG